MKLEDRAYFAGILDGEGSISITKFHGQNRTNKTLGYALCIQIVNRNEELIYWLVENFGGTKRSRNRGGNRSIIHEWSIYGKNCLPVLEAALPYLKIKKKHAQIAIDFIETISPEGTRIGVISDEMIEHKDLLVDSISILNKRGVNTFEATKERNS